LDLPQEVHAQYTHFKKQGYDYEKLKITCSELFEAVHGLLASRLENPHIKHVVGEVRTLQSILGVYKQAHRELRSISVYLNRVVGLFHG
jgi:hypothetical protein